METFLTVVYVLVCLFLITVVLLQAGRGGGMGAAFGGSSQTVFGGAGAGNFLTRLTVIMAGLFMLLSATLAYMSSSSGKALDRASEAVRLREEARDLGGAEGAAVTTEEDPSAASLPGEEGAAAGEEAVEAEAVAGGEEAVEGEAPSEALQAVDEALEATGGTDTETGTDTESEGDTETESETESETETESDTEAETESDTEAAAGIDTESETDTEADTDPAAE